MSGLEQQYLAALDAIEESAAPDRERHVSVLTALSDLYAESERWDDALSTAETAQMIVDQFPDAFEDEDGTIARLECLTAAATALHGLGSTEDAEPLLREAAEVAESVFGRNHVEFAAAAYNLSIALAELNRLDEARSLAQDSVRMLEAALSPDDERLVAARAHLAGIE